MSLSPGTRLGPYEVIAPIGAGGMGQVYRARDTRLNRIVAIKSLQTSVADDPERIARFEREAQLLASLNHPNIAAIHGLQESGGATYLVLEFVDGQTLDEVIRANVELRSANVDVSWALPIARQIADAVAAAHEKGIIHRDLKPGNVMVTGEGQVKVLDFGLGKSIGPDDSGAASQSNSPTITVGATQAGIILGTAAYMSPEQAKGKPVDKRSDVWSFGCVLYEMLTGRRAFQGEDVSDTLASVLKESPAFSQLPATVPPAIRLVVERCLIKDRAARLADMSTARFLLTEPSIISGLSAPSVPVASSAVTQSDMQPAASRSSRFWMGATLLFAASTIALAIAYVSRSTAPAAGGPSSLAVHLGIRVPDGHVVDDVQNQSLAVSPDGRRIVDEVSPGAGKPRLFVRDLDNASAREIAGTEGATYPFFSPNGQWVGFFADNKLKKAPTG